MLHVTQVFAGGAVSRRAGRSTAAAAAAIASSSSTASTALSAVKSVRSKRTSLAESSRASPQPQPPDALYGGRTEGEVLQLAHRMQQRDLTGEVPVASFAYEVLKAHPSVRQMRLRERMAFLCERWERLGKKDRQVYLDDPLRGLL